MTETSQPTSARRNRRSVVRSFLDLIARRRPGELADKALSILRRGGYRGLLRALAESGHFEPSYARWLKSYASLSPSDRTSIREHIERFNNLPRITILMPVCDVQEQYLRLAIESVRGQLYPHWELCISDHGSTLPHVRIVLEEAQRSDPRIKVVYLSETGHIAAALNTALNMATGEFVAVLDHIDMLATHALYLVAALLNQDPDLELIYSDEDKINASGKRFDPCFKPDWNPELATIQDMTCRLGIYRTDTVRKIGGFRSGYEDFANWDLALRVSEVIPEERIRHIPHVLYHRRVIACPTPANINARFSAAQVKLAVVQDHLARTGRRGRALLTPGQHVRIKYETPTNTPLVSILIPTRNGVHLLHQCIASIREKTTYPKYEIVVIDNQSDDPKTLEYLASLKASDVIRLLRYNHPFNYSAINNFAAEAAMGDLLCLMNNDIEVISEDWLTEMAGHAVRTEIGAVGAMLYYPNNTIQHAGVLIGMGGCAGHLYAGEPRGCVGYMDRARLAQNLSAVTAACMVVRKDLYLEVGGLDEQNLPIAFNDVDFCLRLQERGYYNLWTPYAEFYHHESASRGREDTPEKQHRFQGEIDYMRLRWAHLLDLDPAYNPNLTLRNSWPHLASPPRARKPWLS